MAASESQRDQIVTTSSCLHAKGLALGPVQQNRQEAGSSFFLVIGHDMLLQSRRVDSFLIDAALKQRSHR
jgi:hypothetical protein